MKFKFVGEYTGGRESIAFGKVVFHGKEPTDVDDEDLIRRLSGNREFVKVGGPKKAEQ